MLQGEEKIALQNVAESKLPNLTYKCLGSITGIRYNSKLQKAQPGDDCSQDPK